MATTERVWTHPGRPELRVSGHEAPPGPWYYEPDKVQWIDPATDLDCLAVRNPFGAWCGYVGLPPAHPWHGVGYSSCLVEGSTEDYYCEHSPDATVQVHGGLTFAARCSESDRGEAFGICHVPFPSRPHDVWWLGFDCAHFGDKTPCGGRSSPGAEYRDLEYVKSECSSLAAQLARIA